MTIILKCTEANLVPCLFFQIMRPYPWLIYTLVSLCLLNGTPAYKILMIVCPVGSHVMYFGQMAALIGGRGHDVTFLFGSNIRLPDEVTRLNMRVVNYSDPDPPVKDQPMFKEVMHEMAFNPSIFTQMKILDLINIVNSKPPLRLLEDRSVMEWLEGENFDLAIIDGVMPLYQFVPYKLSIPHALLMITCSGHRRSIPIIPSYVPNFMTSFTDKMTFPQRVVNTLVEFVSTVYRMGGEDVSRKYVPELPVTSADDLHKNASLCFQLRDRTLSFVQPTMPDQVLVGSIMARPGAPLAAELQSLMDGSEHGVVLMSLGSVVSDLPDDVQTKLMETFRSIPYDVIMRNKENISHAPDNVHFMSWIPQNDLLAHRNLKLFITHCGINSLMEAAYHGVPVLGFPFGLDQHNNAALVRAKDIGESLLLSDFTTEQLTDGIIRIISDAKYSKNAKKLSDILRDVKQNGLDDPVFWLEHVIKYGAKHLRAHAYEMPGIQYFMIDVLFFLTGVTVVVIAIICLLARCMIRCICRKNKTLKSKDEWVNASIQIGLTPDEVDVDYAEGRRRLCFCNINPRDSAIWDAIHSYSLFKAQRKTEVLDPPPWTKWPPFPHKANAAAAFIVHKETSWNTSSGRT